MHPFTLCWPQTFCIIAVSPTLESPRLFARQVTPFFWQRWACSLGASMWQPLGLHSFSFVYPPHGYADALLRFSLVLRLVTRLSFSGSLYPRSFLQAHKFSLSVPRHSL